MRRFSGTYRRRVLALAAVVSLGAGLLAGCADDGTDAAGSSGGGGGGGGKGKTTVTVGVFGVFGYQQAGLYDAYMKAHPDISIKETSIERNEDYYPRLLTHLGTGSGLADIQAVEVSDIAEVTADRSDAFADLSTAEGVRKEDWLPWKWAQGTTRSGRTIGLGTDIGPMAICYRKDLFHRAGLPTERSAVGRLWAGDWQKYLDVGARYASNAPHGTAFVDSAAGVYNAVISSSAERYYDADGKVVYKTNPAVRDAWRLATRAATGKLTAGLQQFRKPWDRAFADGRFASVSCPPWMLGYIKEKAGPAAAGRWDVVAAPRPGNWGGSFLTVPRAGRHQAEAARLAAWLTAPEQQTTLFEKQGSFPSSQAAYDLPQVADARHPYFGDAPIGTVFAAAAEGVPTQPLGPEDSLIAQHIADIGLLRVDQRGTSPDAGWQAATRTIDHTLDQ